MASHCNDLYSISADDSTEMLAAKTRISELVALWLGIEVDVPTTTELPTITTTTNELS